jgi:hypothetical protein
MIEPDRPQALVNGVTAEVDWATPYRLANLLSLRSLSRDLTNGRKSQKRFRIKSKLVEFPL